MDSTQLHQAIVWQQQQQRQICTRKTIDIAEHECSRLVTQSLTKYVFIGRFRLSSLCVCSAADKS